MQLGLSSIWTEARKRGCSMADLVRWLSTAPSHFAGLSDRKGSIAVGMDADFVIWDPDDSFELQPEDLRFRHKLSPYLGKHLHGRVHSTYLRGRLAYQGGEMIGAPSGQALFHRGLKHAE